MSTSMRTESTSPYVCPFSTLDGNDAARCSVSSPRCSSMAARYRRIRSSAQADAQVAADPGERSRPQRGRSGRPIAINEQVRAVRPRRTRVEARGRARNASSQQVGVWDDLMADRTHDDRRRYDRRAAPRYGRERCRSDPLVVGTRGGDQKFERGSERRTYQPCDRCNHHPHGRCTGSAQHSSGIARNAGPQGSPSVTRHSSGRTECPRTARTTRGASHSSRQIRAFVGERLRIHSRARQWVLLLRARQAARSPHKQQSVRAPLQIYGFSLRARVSMRTPRSSSSSARAEATHTWLRVRLVSGRIAPEFWRRLMAA